MRITERRLVNCALTAGAVVSLWGCRGRDPSEAAEFLPQENDVVEAYGLRLDDQAPPEHSAWAILMALRDDVRSRYGSEAWRQTMKLECRLTNVELLRAIFEGKVKSEHYSVDDWVFDRVRGWAPVINYYADFFDDDFASAKDRLHTRIILDAVLPEPLRDTSQTARVSYVVPGGDTHSGAGSDAGVSIEISLAQTQNKYWRVYAVTLRALPYGGTT